MTKAAPLAIFSSLPVILGCALLGATEARAVPYEVTIGPGVTPDTIFATSNDGGAFDLTGLTPTQPPFGQADRLIPSTARLKIGGGDEFIVYTVDAGALSGPSNFGTGGRIDGTGNGPSVGIARMDVSAGITSDNVLIPVGYNTLTPLDISTATFPGDFASLVANGSLVPGVHTWTWDGGGPGTLFPERSFTIDVVPGPVVGAGVPGLIAALGGLVAMARRRRKQLA